MGKKKKAQDNERISVLENARKQHNYHIGRLEQMLRLLDNNDLAPDQVRLQLQQFLRVVALLKLLLILMMPSRSFLFGGTILVPFSSMDNSWSMAVAAYSEHSRPRPVLWYDA